MAAPTLPIRRDHAWAVELLRQAVVLPVLVGLLATVGCRQEATPEDARQQAAEDFGQLPGLAGAPDPRLQNELARIIDEGGTPALLAENRIAESENVAAGLTHLFPAKKVGSIFAESGEIFPPRQFTFNPLALEKAIRFRKKYEVQRQQVRQALGRGACNFGIHFEEGFAADLGFIDLVRLCARLEAFGAAESLADDDLDAAAESLGAMFRLAACLAGEKHAMARLEGAFCRTEALGVLRAIVEHPKTTQNHLERLAGLIRGQLDAWPPDADAWIGDRALGMYAYESVRAGKIRELLTEEEIRQFSEEKALLDLPAAAQRTVNQDELYYLQTMRKIIEACARPYHARVELFQQIREDLHRRRASPDFPLVAGRLLLPDIEKGHRIQARDRAICEAWALALAAGSGAEPPPYQINPLTGKSYRVVREEGLVTVANEGMGEDGDDSPVIVPDLAPPAIEE